MAKPSGFVPVAIFTRYPQLFHYFPLRQKPYFKVVLLLEVVDNGGPEPLTHDYNGAVTKLY